jgi:acyl-coenzyme A thioesterase PaaI-like protein
MNTDLFMDTRCFACGKDNTHGLHLDIKKSGQDEAVTAFKVPHWCQGYERIVHGGIVATVLDELIVWAAHYAGYKCVTAELTVRIKTSLLVNTEYIGYGSIQKQRHRFMKAYAEIRDNRDRVYAYGHAKLMRMA